MPSSIDFNHVGIKCSDQERSLKFYTEVLGLKELYRVQIMGNDCIFVGDDNFSIELEVSAPECELPDQSSCLGLQHLCFHVTGIDEYAARLEKAGVEFIIKPFAIRPERKTSFFKDPDGVRIQLIEDIDPK